MIPLHPVFSIIVNNIRRTGFPFPLNKRDCFKWAEELKIPRHGEVFLYTSCLYQLIPYINAITRWLERAEHSSIIKTGLRLLGRFPSLSSLSRIIIRPDRREIERFVQIPKKIAEVLTKLGVNFASLYDNDIYSGALLYDLGLDDYFQEHAERVYKIFRENNVKKVITIDPHTTYVLKSIYPEFIDGFDIEVESYLEVLVEKIGNKSEKSEKITIHDPCLYARELGIINEPRRIIESLGFEIEEAKHSRIHTMCCGGPIESIAPEMSRKIAKARLMELSQKSKKIVAMCPICIANLRRHAEEGLEIVDISELIFDRMMK